MAGQPAALQYAGPQAAATKAGKMTEVRWGILGAANFARQFMGPALTMAPGGHVAALATSDPAKAAAFNRALLQGEAYACPLEFSRGTQLMIDAALASAA